jgi:hypothetical protein
MADFNGSHGLFISAFFADGIPKRLWTLTIAFFCLPHYTQWEGRKVVTGVIAKLVLRNNLRASVKDKTW